MIEILNSAEVRWFFSSDPPGKGSQTSPPSHVKEWFQQGSDLVWPPKERTDCYLLLPGCETTSVKQREGRFEVKAIQGGSETVSYGIGISGRSEAWIKWSYGKEGVEIFINALEQEPEGWIDVIKWRWLRKFSLDKTVPIEVNINDFPMQGCNIELTALKASDSYWWTFSLEGFGSADSVRENLRIVANHFFAKTKPPLSLNTTNSCAYPVWLNSIIDHIDNEKRSVPN
jgi:hypothetical protein